MYTCGKGRPESSINTGAGVEAHRIALLISAASGKPGRFRMMQLAFLAPSLAQRLLDGTQPANLTATRLKRIGDLPLLGDEQIAALG